MDIYEVQIAIGHEVGSSSYYCDHRFPSFPARETVVALKAEAWDTFAALFGMEADWATVRVIYLDAEERKAAEQVPVKA